jgi:hypothetical protein
MATDDSTFATGPLRFLLSMNHALQWASSVIVLGIAVWLSGALDRTLHEVYWISIVSSFWETRGVSYLRLLGRNKRMVLRLGNVYAISQEL